jgi:hypothetical protein
MLLPAARADRAPSREEGNDVTTTVSRPTAPRPAR